MKDNGLYEFASSIDSKLRNDMAHINFVLKDGEIYIRGKKVIKVIPNSFTRLALALLTVDILLERFSKEKNLIENKVGVKNE